MEAGSGLPEVVAQGGGGERGVVVGDEIGDEARVPGGVLAQGGDGVANTGVLFEGRFDLAELDADAADLHLLVEAAQVEQGAIGARADAIAGLVEARAGLSAEGVRHERRRRQLRPVQIAAGEARPADIELAGDPDGRRVLVGIEHIELGIGDGPPDGHAGEGFIGRDFIEGGVGRDFGRAVEVEESTLRQALPKHLDQVDRERLATADPQLQIWQAAVERGVALQNHAQ